MEEKHDKKNFIQPNHNYYIFIIINYKLLSLTTYSSLVFKLLHATCVLFNLTYYLLI
jgi:hypothetical protein